MAGREVDERGAGQRQELPAEQPLRLEPFERLANALPFGVTLWRRQTQDPGELLFIYANPEACRQAGSDLTQRFGKTMREAFPGALLKDDQSSVPRMFQRAAERGESERMIGVRYTDTARSDQWFDAQAIPLGDGLVAVVYENVSARLSAEQEIRGVNLELERSISTGERRYRSIFDSASVGLWETDLSQLRAYLDRLDTQGLEIEAHLRTHRELVAGAAALWPIREVNDAAVRQLGRRRDDLPASLGEIVRNVSESAWLSLLTAIAQGASTFETELALERLDGDQHLLVSMTLPRDERHLDHVVVSMLDVTERKRLERELWTAQRMEAIGHLTGGVAHDFNNLLMVISSYAGFVLDQLQTESQAREDVKVIQDAASRAAELTNQLLAFGRRQVQQLEIVNLNLVVGELDKMLRRVIGEHIELAIGLDRELGWVKADRLQMEQILMNLAVNARDAMAQGGQLSIQTTNVQVDSSIARAKGDQVPVGSYVMVSVSDTGIGMDEPTQLRIFEPFFTTKERGRGTGLGLSTVFGIVKQSDGHIWVQSELGRGTTFEVYLPRVEESGNVIQRAAQTSPPPGRETVLLVEDEQMVRAAARRILERHGYCVLEASHGREALALCEEQGATIDLMITDVVMPHMSGYELARQLAARRPQLKVIYVSGYSDSTAAEHGAVDAESMTFIQKPFAPDTLLRKVRELLDP